MDGLNKKNNLIIFSKIGLIICVIVSFSTMATFYFPLYHVLSQVLRITLIISIYPIVRYDKSSFTNCWFLFFVIVLFICFVHGDFSYSYLIFVLFMFSSYYIYDSNFLLWIQKVVEIFCAIHLAGAYFEILFQDQYYNFFLKKLSDSDYSDVIKFFDAPGYICGFTVQPAVLATFLILGFGACISQALLTNRKRYYLQAVLYFIAIIMTSKRAHLLFGIISFFLCWIVIKVNRNNYLKILRVVIMACFLLGGLFFLYKRFEMFEGLKRFFDLVEIFSSRGDLDALSSGRMYLYTRALEFFKQSPLFGIGFNQFQFRSGEGLAVHNVYLQFLCEGGIFTFIFFIIGVINSFLITCKTTKDVWNNNLYEWKYLTLFSLYVQTFFICYFMTGMSMVDYGHVYIFSIALLYIHSCNYILQKKGIIKKK